MKYQPLLRKSIDISFSPWLEKWKGEQEINCSHIKKQVSLDKNSIDFSLLIGLKKHYLKHELEVEKFGAFGNLIFCKSHR